MKTPREVAKEMVPEPGAGMPERRSRTEASVLLWRTRIEDADDYVPLEVQDSAADAWTIVRDARGIVERLVVRERNPLVALLREVADGYRDDLARISQLQWLGCARETRLLRMLAKVEAALDVSA